MQIHMPGAQPEILQGRGGFLGKGQFDKHFICKEIKDLKEMTRGEIFRSFSPRYSQNSIVVTKRSHILKQTCS